MITRHVETPHGVCQTAWQLLLGGRPSGHTATLWKPQIHDCRSTLTRPKSCLKLKLRPRATGAGRAHTHASSHRISGALLRLLSMWFEATSHYHGRAAAAVAWWPGRKAGDCDPHCTWCHTWRWKPQCARLLLCRLRLGHAMHVACTKERRGGAAGESRLERAARACAWRECSYSTTANSPTRGVV